MQAVDTREGNEEEEDPKGDGGCDHDEGDEDAADQREDSFHAGRFISSEPRSR